MDAHGGPARSSSSTNTDNASIQQRSSDKRAAAGTTTNFPLFLSPPPPLSPSPPLSLPLTLRSSRCDLGTACTSRLRDRNLLRTPPARLPRSAARPSVINSSLTHSTETPNLSNAARRSSRALKPQAMHRKGGKMAVADEKTNCCVQQSKTRQEWFELSSRVGCQEKGKRFTSHKHC